jgi:hypothetical protein
MTFYFVYPKHLYSRTRYAEMLISQAYSEGITQKNLDFKGIIHLTL